MCETEIAALGMWKIRHSGVIYSQHYVLQQHGVGRKGSFFTETTNRKKSLNNKHSKRAPNPSQNNMKLYIPKVIN